MDNSNEDLQRRLKEQSLEGESGKRDPNRKIKMKLKDYKKTLAAVAIAASIATSVVIGGGSAVANHLNESMLVGSLISDFRQECIYKETHRTDDLQHYYYDYPDIATYIEGMEDFDLGVYLAYKSIGEHQTDQVMRYTNYRSFENYLEAHDFDDAAAFDKAMKKHAALTAEVNQKQEELKQMKEEQSVKSDDPSEDQMGGTK